MRLVGALSRSFFVLGYTNVLTFLPICGLMVALGPCWICCWCLTLVCFPMFPLSHPLDSRITLFSSVISLVRPRSFQHQLGYAVCGPIKKWILRTSTNFCCRQTGHLFLLHQLLTEPGFMESIVFSVVHKKIPSKLIDHIRPACPGITKEIAALIRDKHKAWRTFKRSASSEHLATFWEICNKVTSKLHSAERKHLQTLHRDVRLNSSPSSIKNFWRYIKRITGKVKASTVPDLQSVDPDGNPVTVSEDCKKANLLNTFFVEQTHLANAPFPFPDLSEMYKDGPVADSLSTTPTKVYDILTHLKRGKTPGLDEIPPQLLRHCACGISNSLCTLFNRSFEDCCVPSQWKEALVVPIHKGDSKNTIRIITAQ